MYSNVFDTVKNSNIDLINFEGLLYSSILSGLHPTFSLNQAIDSTALLNIAKNNKTFLEFIRNRYIKVALFSGYTETPDAMTLFLKNKLNGSVKENKTIFKFSSLPFLYTEKYNEEQRVKIYKAMLDMLEDSKISFSQYQAQNIGIELDDAYKIESYLLTVKEIEDNINGHYISSIDTSGKPTLYEKVMGSIDNLLQEIKEKEETTDILDCLRDFKHLLEMQKSQNVSMQILNSRTNMYSLIDELKCSSKNEDELKAIIDLRYNEVVAASINDDEDEIIINNSNYEYVQLYENNDDNTLDKVNQKLSIVRSSQINHKDVLTWELLNEILKEANPDKKDIDKWYNNMQEYCKKLSMENFALHKKRIIHGSISFGINVLEYAVLVALFQELNIDSQFGFQIAQHMANQFTSDILGYVIGVPTDRDLSSQIKQNNLKHDIVKHLTSQVALLKKRP